MPDGSVRWQRWSERAIFNNSGAVIEYQSVGRDISERIAVEGALQRSERQFRNLAENSPDIIEQHTADARCLYISPACRAVLGYDPEEIIGQSVIGYLHPDDVPVIAGYRKDVNPEKPSAKVSFRIRHKDGRYIWCEAYFRGLFDENGSLLEILSIIRDITEQRNAEEEIRKKTEDLDNRNRLITTLLDTIPIGIFMVEAPSGKPIIANREACRLLGRGILPDTTELSLSEVYKAYRAGTVLRYPTAEMPIVRGMYGESHHIDDMIVVRPDGTIVQLEIFGTPVTDTHGRVVSSLVSFLDISERKKAEMVLTQANRKINLLASITRHDVKNQITVLRGYARVLMRKRSDPEIAGP
jgi:PAS domain S-box-containing protein